MPSILVTTLCSCASLNSDSANQRPAPAVENISTELPGVASLGAVNSGPIQRMSHVAAAPAGSVRPGMAIRPVSGAGLPVCPPGEWSAPDARLPADGFDATGATSQEVLARSFPDEYLFDGGDRGFPVHENDSSVLGLETEDTVAEYRDDEGRRHINPTNRVAIYAPRFAAVASVSAPTEGVAVGRAAGAKVTTLGTGLRSQVASVNHEQREGTERLVTRLRTSGLESGVGQNSVSLPVGAVGFQHGNKAVENLTFLRTGMFEKADEAQIAAAIQSAVTLTRDQNPMIAARTDGPGELETSSHSAQFVATEITSKKGVLRIVKLADKTSATTGTVVTFTIRYDNLGDREVRDVVIMDNLTPRLAYVEDSGTSDRDGELTTTENGEGSVILRWTLDQPLPGHKGGVVTFQARVK